MKKIVLLMMAVCLLALPACSKGSTEPEGAEAGGDEAVTADNSRDSLDWVGNYEGRFAGADSEIDMSLTLSETEYVRISKYTDKSNENFVEEGTFEWDAAGDTITLFGGDDGTTPTGRYRVGEGTLTELDENGEPFDDDANHVLTKVRFDDEAEGSGEAENPDANAE